MDFAGTETLLMNLYRNIDREIIQFDFAVCSDHAGDYDEEILNMGGRIFHYPRYRGKNHLSYRNWWEHFFDVHDEYKIVHGHIGSTAAIYLNIAKKRGSFTIAHSHSVSRDKGVKAFTYNVFSYPTRYIADQFFGCSKQALIDRYGKKVASDSTRSAVLNNAIDAEKYIFNTEKRAEIRKQYGAAERDIVIATVGRLTAAKNPEEIVRICERLRDNGNEFVFWWFGKGELEKDIRQEVEAKSLDEYIHFMGVRDDIYNVLQGADLFLFPSIWEGLGIACIEAQASGLPTLCSDVIPEEAKVSDNCRFLKLNDTQLWCDEINKTIRAITEDTYVRPNNYDIVRDKGYDIKAVAAWLQSFYENKYLELNGTQEK